MCVDFDNPKKEAKEHKLLESDLIRTLEKHRGKGKYDVLAMCSGGKDSTSALYYMKTRYKLNPLAFTFDNGFETEGALRNVEKAAEVLGVDRLYFKSSYMKGMFSKILETKSAAIPCHLCSIWYMGLAFDIAARFEIPIIIAGWTKGQSTQQPVMSKCACNVDAPEFKTMGAATHEFVSAHLKNDPRYKDFPASMEDVLTKAQSKHKVLVLSPHWFLPFDQETYVETIRRELGWEYPKQSYPGRSTNCAMNFISVDISMRNYGYTHYHVEMSKMIRQGLLTREEALRDLEIKITEEELAVIAGKLKPGQSGNA